MYLAILPVSRTQKGDEQMSLCDACEAAALQRKFLQKASIMQVTFESALTAAKPSFSLMEWTGSILFVLIVKYKLAAAPVLR